MQDNCMLKGKCKRVGTDDCHVRCYAYLKLHGESGTGGILGLANVPSKFATLTIDDLPFAKENPNAAAIVTRYCSSILSPVGKGTGLYLYSIPNEKNPKGCGTGKTTAAAIIINEFVIARVITHLKKECRIDEVPAFFGSVSKFQNTYNSQFRGTKEMQDEASRKYYNTKERMQTVELLVLDDIGIRDATEAFKNEFYEVIDERVSEGRATIFTSNVPIQTVGEMMDERIASRIEGATVPVTFVGEDKRKRGGF